ncbi:MAG: DsbA family protein [Thermoleophilia bacterium]
MKKQHYVVILSAIFLMTAFASGGYFYNSQQSEKQNQLTRDNSELLVRDYSLTLGSDDAKVQIVEFFDPACETCKDFYTYVKGLMDANPGKIKLVMRYAPFHQGADYNVKILEAARKQGKYWETLGAMYDGQAMWASHSNPQPEKVWQYVATVAGLNLDQVKKDMNDPEIAKMIQQDLSDAKGLNVTKTPEFFVNGNPLPSFGYKQLKGLVDSEIQANY